MRNEYLSQDINNPKYLFHGSPEKLEILNPRQSHDSNGNKVNIANAVFLFPSFLKSTPYAFKDTIKKNSEGLNWKFEITNNDEYPLMVMENVNVDTDIVGYIYVILNDGTIQKDEGKSLQYKSFHPLTPIDVVEVHYNDFKDYYENKDLKKKLAQAGKLI